MKDRLLGILLLIICAIGTYSALTVLFIDSTEAAADELDFARYLIEEQKELNSPVCDEHDPDELSDEQESNIIIGFALSYCSNYVRHVRHNYVLGWRLYLEAGEYIESLDCDCSLHTHADSMAYNTYLELTKALTDGGEVSPTRVAYCDALAVATEE